eukprot:1609930-Pyramimonas_sp.AAC.1
MAQSDRWTRVLRPLQRCWRCVGADHLAETAPTAVPQPGGYRRLLEQVGDDLRGAPQRPPQLRGHGAARAPGPPADPRLLLGQAQAAE